LSPDPEDDDGKFYTHTPKTEIGARNATIIALYGSITPYTLYRYWWVDSIAKQTIMLADAGGLRKKQAGIKKNGAPRKERTEEEKKKVLAGLFGKIAESETNEEKADRIRNELKDKQHGNQ